MTVGDRIKIARESIGMTQGELGKICGVTKQTIFKYENNIITNIPLDKLKLISSGLNISAAKLMDWETEDGGIDLGIAQYETGLSAEEVENLIDTKKSPSAAEAAPGESAIELFNYINQALVSMGFIGAIDDITDQQAEIILGVCRILHAAFDNR